MRREKKARSILNNEEKSLSKIRKHFRLVFSKVQDV